MTKELEFEKDGKYFWGALFSTDTDDETTSIAGIIGDYNNLPRMLNKYCQDYIKQKGRGVEQVKIRPQIKDILLDVYDLLADYGNQVVGHIREGKPLRYELLGLDLEECKKILRECRSVNLETDEIKCEVALFGTILKSFYLNLDTKFLPNDLRDTCKYLSKSITLNDDYSLGKLMISLWENHPRSEINRVFVGLEKLANQIEKSGKTLFVGEKPCIF